MMGNFAENIIYQNETIRQGLLKLNNLPGTDNHTLFVLDDSNKLVGTITDGDIRRGLIKGNTVDEEVKEVMFTNFRFLRKNHYTISEINKIKSNKIQIIPLLDDEGRILKIIDFSKQTSLLPLDAVIMAGGVGQRLKPLTDKTPKPLLLVGDKPIIEHNIDRLIKFGIQRIVISIGYLGNQLVDYFKDGSSKQIQIEYVEEKQPLGTIGALKLIDNFNHKYILLMNSDLLTNIDFEDFYIQAEKEGSDISIATIPYKVDIPYAILEVNQSSVVKLQEKPTYTYFANAGIYLINKECIKSIPEGEFYNATDFIEKLMSLGKKVTHYSILEYWLDIGKMEDFKKAQDDIKHLKL